MDSKFTACLTYFVYSQSLREFFLTGQSSIEMTCRPTDGSEELSFDEVICKDKELFPKNLF